MNTQTLERPQTHTATVTVQYLNPAKSPGKSGSIKDEAGQYFGVRPAMLSSFEPGETYQVEFTAKVVNGVMYRDVVRIIAPAAQSVAPRQANFLTREEIEAQRRPAAQQQRTAPVQQHTPAPQNNHMKSWSPEDKQSAFRCACVTAAIESRQVALKSDAIADLICEIDTGYELAMMRMQKLQSQG